VIATRDQFGGVARLYGETGLDRLRKAHVAVVGIGGVGSWAAEALGRSGIGRITLIDLDDVCVTNTNRQLHALTTTIGKPKVDVMADRIRTITPDCEATAIHAFWTKSTEAELLAKDFDLVVDAIDGMSAKACVIGGCHHHGMPIVTSGGAGGRRDPTQIRSSDLAFAIRDPLLRLVRKKLRKEYGFPKGGSEAFGIPCVYSEEQPVFPWADGCVRNEPEPGTALQLDCSSGLGTVCQVTGGFGFALASIAIKKLLTQ